MVISRSEQEEADFDWFGVDVDRHVGHFTTAGFKLLPSSISGSAEDLELVTDYFARRASVRCTHTIDGNLANEVKDWNGEGNESRYLASPL
jgi:hypothetical protein